MEDGWKKQCWGGEESSCDEGPAWQPLLALRGALELNRPVTDVSYWSRISSPLHIDQSLCAGYPRMGVTLGKGVLCG